MEMSGWIVIAGGCGFLGSNLCEALLTSGHRVVAIDDASTGRWKNISHLSARYGTDHFKTVEHDIRHTTLGLVRSTLKDDPVSAVCNFASPASPPAYLARPIETLEIGSIGTQNLVLTALGYGARFLQASTSEVYGDPSVHPQTETYWGNVNPIGPRAVYDEAKRFGEAMCTAYERHLGLDLRLLRIFNTYGPRMRADDGRVVTNFINQALTGNPLTVYGDGSQTRSFCYVDDLIRGIIALLWSDHIGPLNLGNPTEFTMLELANVVIASTNSTSAIEFRPLPVDDPKQRRPDIALANTVLGWNPTIALAEGVRRTVDWFQQPANVGSHDFK
jgi:dTDP-glucose 4,6-dehydratase